MAQIAVPGAFLVDVVPPRECGCINSFVDAGTHLQYDTVVRHLPSWFPGVQFHRFAEKVREDAYNAVHLPFDHVADAIEVGVFVMIVIDRVNLGPQLGGNIEPSIVSTHLGDFENLSDGGVDKEVISTTAGMVYLGEHPGIVVRSAFS